MGDKMDKILKLYNELILKAIPTNNWIRIRFILHWLTLPLKIILIGSLGIFQIISKKFKRPRELTNKELPTYGLKVKYFNEALNELPILKTLELECYVNRVPYFSYPNGYNHNPDHQCSRHSTYYFLMKKLGLNNEKMEIPLSMFMQNKWLARGFSWNPYENNIDYNVKSTSGDMLCGLNLAIMSQEHPSEKFDQLITNIIENDYALLEGASPEKDDYGYDLYNKLLKESGYRMESVKMKSARGMWQPGLETVGAQALTILSALRLAEVKNGNREAGKEYRKLLFKYGYGLLSLFPTAYIDSKRGYFNDHNCLIALYVLSKCSKTKLGKLFWKIPMLYVWMLSKHWYNGYFTGLVKDCYPESVDQKYIDECIKYLYDQKPRTYVYAERTEIKSKDEPVTYNLNVHDEFSPDVRYDMMISNVNENGDKYKTGLGFIANAIMLEKDPKVLLT
jgi:hypothetical protein